MKPMPLLAQKIVSGLIAGWFAAVAFGFVIGMFTYFLGSIPGAIIGYVVGFRWGYKRIGVAVPDGSGAMPVTVGDTAFLALGFFGFLWLAIALPDLLFGYSAPYKGHVLGIILPILGLLLSPFVALTAQAQARKRLTSPLRDVAGIALIVAFLGSIALWWNWAEARDQAKARHPYSLSWKRGQNPL